MEDKKFFCFVMHTVDPKSLLENLDVLFDSLKNSAKLKIAFGFVLKNVEDVLFERSKLVGTTEDLTEIKNILSNNDVHESCAGEGAKPEWKWKFPKLTNVAISAALITDVPVGCKRLYCQILFSKILLLNVQHLRRILESHKMIICVFWSSGVLHLYGNEKLEEQPSKLFNLFVKKAGRTDPANIWGYF